MILIDSSQHSPPQPSVKTGIAMKLCLKWNLFVEALLPAANTRRKALQASLACAAAAAGSSEEGATEQPPPELFKIRTNQSSNGGTSALDMQSEMQKLHWSPLRSKKWTYARAQIWRSCWNNSAGA
ncbi:hypothetical protein [Synechococcus sp. CBW1107]|uniref:hypothetical protein n=1 Tax=Synechococcus sp. CBW1107 TaxID=2789857 RepID=UPI002AD3CFB9|nr:hypothetical protein [Synechococcus sp. CBW1107]